MRYTLLVASNAFAISCNDLDYKEKINSFNYSKNNWIAVYFWKLCCVKFIDFFLYSQSYIGKVEQSNRVTTTILNYNIINQNFILSNNPKLRTKLIVIDTKLHSCKLSRWKFISIQKIRNTSLKICIFTRLWFRCALNSKVRKIERSIIKYKGLRKESDLLLFVDKFRAVEKELRII